MFTRQQLIDSGKIDCYPYSVFALAYKALANEKLNKIKLYHSEVYYCRAAIEKHSGFLFSLPDVEKAMKAEGWRENVRKK